MFRKIKNKSISERVAESLSHNSDASDRNSDSEPIPKVICFEEEDYDFQENEANKSFSQIRKQNIKLLSEQSYKYRGEIASREIANTSDDYATSDDCEHSEGVHADCEYEEESSDETSYSSKKSEVFESENECEESSQDNIVSPKSNKLETEKGLSVQNQLATWEKLLEIRIHSQKMLNKANSLPCPDNFNKLASKNDFKDAAQEVRKNAELLLGKLMETQVSLANQFSEVKKLNMSNRTHSKSNDNIVSSSKRYALAMESNFKKFQPYRNSVLLKWDDRTKLLAPSGATKRDHIAEEFNVVQKIDNILIKRDDHIAKSQKLKGNYKLFGSDHLKSDEKREVSSAHVYDDTDFYHSQLRELIEFKSNISSNAYDVTKQFAELQKLRQKMKKKVDTRASKGRKIRYVVHHKLVNFMAPYNTSEWTEESKNELYRSLFVT